MLFRSPGDCSMVVNLKDYKDVTLFLHDLEDLWNCNVKKEIGRASCRERV